MFAKRRDVIIVAVIATVFLVMLFLLRHGDGGVAVVEVDGEVIAHYDLSGEQKEVALEQNSEVVLSFGEDGAYFVRSNCPDQVCVNSGIIHRAGEMAACLPNGVIIHIEGESDTDVVV